MTDHNSDDQADTQLAPHNLDASPETGTWRNDWMAKLLESTANAETMAAPQTTPPPDADTGLAYAYAPPVVDFPPTGSVFDGGDFVARADPSWRMVGATLAGRRQKRSWWKRATGVEDTLGWFATLGIATMIITGAIAAFVCIIILGGMIMFIVSG